MSNTPAAQRNEPKLIGIEVMRFISAFAVLVWHYQHFIIPEKSADFDRSIQPFYPVLKLMYHYGFYGVEVFWAISGYIFFWKYRYKVAEKKVGRREFFILRFSRLYPLHLLTLLMVAVLQFFYIKTHHVSFIYPDNDWKHFIGQLFLATNWGFERSVSFNGPVWSISLEVLAYLIFFLSLRWLGSSEKYAILIYFLVWVGRKLGIEYPLLDCLLYFYLGGLVAIFQEKWKPHERKLTWFCLVLIVGLIVAANFQAALHISISASDFLIYGLPALIYLLSSHVDFPARFHPAIVAAGNMTYSSYLIHFPLQVLIALVYLELNQKIPYQSKIFFLAFLITTFILARLLYTQFEMPAQNFLRKRMLRKA